MNKNISDTQLIQVLQKMIAELNTKKDLFERIKSSDEDLISKWQTFLGIILPVQIKCIQDLGFSADQSGLSGFNEVLMKHQIENSKILELNNLKWDMTLNLAFEANLNINITLEKAQKIVLDLVDSITSPAFLSQIDKIMLDMDKRATMLDKRKKILTELLPLQMSVFGKHGFEGEQGYICAQKCLLDYYHDPLISQKATFGMKTLFERANII